MAAASAVLQALEPGVRILVPHSMYWAFRKWLIEFASNWQIELAFYKNADIEDLEHRLAARPTRLLWIETPANPTWEVTDIHAAAELAHRHGATVVVDSTVSTPVLTRPLELGADIVMHSATKYLNGHSDVLAGVLVTREENQRWTDIRVLRSKMGAPLAPLECFLLLRGLRTVFVRYRQCSANALAIARHFEAHPKVARVLYPGLASHPGHAIARRQMRDGFGGMMSLLVKGGFSDAQKLCTRLKVIVPATSLGGVESLAEHRKTVEGPTSPVPDNLVRLSIGIEHPDDLIADLEQALAGV
jgi:cystathionine gamma-synthase